MKPQFIALILLALVYLSEAASLDAADWTLMKAWDNGKSDLSQNGHLVRPAGKSLRVAGRVVSIALAREGEFLVAKTTDGLAMVDADRFKLVNQYPAPENLSMHGLAVSSGGHVIYFTGGTRSLYSAKIDAKGTLGNFAAIDLRAGRSSVYPLGIAVGPDDKRAVAALSGANEVAVIDLVKKKVVGRVAVGVCPYGVVISRDGGTALVSNFGGGRPNVSGTQSVPDTLSRSAGSPVAVDSRGVALRGTVSVIDLNSLTVLNEIATRIHPEAMVLSPDGRLAYVVDDSGDGVSVIDIARRAVVNQLDTKPSPELPYGSLTAGLAISADGQTLYTANAGNNAIKVAGVLRMPSAGTRSVPDTFIPAGGFPGSVCLRGDELFIGNVYEHPGGLQKVKLPATAAERQEMTQRAKDGFHFAEIMRAQQAAEQGVAPRPVPARPGEPSTIKHVVYIIKENKKYDQVLGDIGRGNSEPRLCEFPRATTPNAHALADQFVLLDNYYCNGVRSSDGHQWAVQGITTPYREKDWNSIRCPYDFGGDPLCYAGCGFIWDHLLRRGVSFRNFGEMNYPVLTAGRTWHDFYRSWKNHDGKARFRSEIALDSLRRYSDLRYPGWDLTIPDQLRADVFLAALGEFERAGSMPEFVILYLPNDHGFKGTKNFPTPRAYVADNDLALGRVIEGLSRSPFWRDMAIFVNEDDPQTGADHVDGHRSICFVAGPYVKRGGAAVSRFYNQDSVLHTICRIFAAPPMNQLVAWPR